MLLSNISVFAQSHPPVTKKTPVTDTYYGKQVVDNYRWLENVNDPEVQSWFKSQGEYTDNIMKKIPGRDSLVKEWMALDKLKPAERYRLSMHNNRYFYLKQLPEEKVGKLYYRDGKSGKEILLFDPATYAGEKGKTYSINQFVENNDGSKVALCVTEGGAEVGTIRIMNVATKKWYSESIYPTWSGITGWTKDGNSFFVLRLQTGDQNAPEFPSI
jgi:prolyl oligopeptidase